MLKIKLNSSIIKTEIKSTIRYNNSSTIRKERKGCEQNSRINRDRFIELGLTIAALRKMKGMSQEQLAEKAKISRSHLSSIEAPNIVRPFSVEVLYNIADALEVRAGDLLNSTLPASKK